MTLKQDIHKVHSTYEQTTRLLDSLRGDKRKLEQLLDKVVTFTTHAPQLATRIDALTAQIADAEARASKTSGIADSVDALAGKLDALAPRTQVVDELETRLNGLHALSADVDPFVELLGDLHRPPDLEVELA